MYPAASELALETAEEDDEDDILLDEIEDDTDDALLEDTLLEDILLDDARLDLGAELDDAGTDATLLEDEITARALETLALLERGIDEAALEELTTEDTARLLDTEDFELAVELVLDFEPVVLAVVMENQFILNPPTVALMPNVCGPALSVTVRSTVTHFSQPPVLGTLMRSTLEMDPPTLLNKNVLPE